MDLQHLTRRKLLKSAVAGTAATIPVTATAVTIDTPTLTAEERVEACIDQLKSVLAELHPGCDAPSGQYVVTKHGSGTVIVSAIPPKVPWTGPGNYELLWNGGKNRNVFHVERIWSDMDQCWGYWAAVIWDGHRISPRGYYTDRTLHILRKVSE